jgi:LacI family transcriptional regulator
MTLKQFAKELNLSFSAVSKALRDSHEISSATKERVLAKAKELNFQVNPVASSFRNQKTKTIAVVIPEVVNDFFGPVISGIESIAQEKGFHVLIYLTHESIQKETAVTKLLETGRVDGVLMSLSEQTTGTAHIKALQEKDIAVVFFDRIAELIDTPKVTTDDVNCGRRATEHLVENGCRRIAFLSISQNLSICNKRMEGYFEALKKNNLPMDGKLVLQLDKDDSKNKLQLRKLLTRKNRPDAIFACVEKLAITTYELCGELKIKIPDDLKVITFSNSYTAGLLNPSLTTITQPAFEMGREAAAILFRMVEKKGHPVTNENTILKSSLVERDSTKNVSLS